VSLDEKHRIKLFDYRMADKSAHFGVYPERKSAGLKSKGSESCMEKSNDLLVISRWGLSEKPGGFSS
jgi:hypothetical protein